MSYSVYYCIRYGLLLPKEQAGDLEVIESKMKQHAAMTFDTGRFRYRLLKTGTGVFGGDDKVFEGGWLKNELRGGAGYVELVPFLMLDGGATLRSKVLALYSTAQHDCLRCFTPSPFERYVIGEPMAIELLRREEVVPAWNSSESRECFASLTEVCARPTALAKLSVASAKEQIPPHLASLADMMMAVPAFAPFADPSIVWIFASLCPWMKKGDDERDRKWCANLEQGLSGLYPIWRPSPPPHLLNEGSSSSVSHPARPPSFRIEPGTGAIGLTFTNSMEATRWADSVSCYGGGVTTLLRDVVGFTGVPRYHFDVPVPIRRGGIAAVLHAKTLLRHFSDCR